MTVPTPAELAARLTVARAIAADYAREARGESGGYRPDWYAWAARLHQALTGVLGALGTVTSGPAVVGYVEIAAADVGTVLGALSDATDYRAARGEVNTVARYRALAYRLGDDR